MPVVISMAPTHPLLALTTLGDKRDGTRAFCFTSLPSEEAPMGESEQV